MLHPRIELRPVDQTIGYGVFAVDRIPQGTITWVRDPLDQIVDERKMEWFGADVPEAILKYTYLDGRGDRVLCWDLARFMNHSCEANTLSPGLSFDIALRDIEAGEEVTTDYGALNLEEAFSCACASGKCRRRVRPEDFEEMAPGWDERLALAFARVGDVDQPLWGLIHDQRFVRAALDDPSRIPSILRNRWPTAAQDVQSVAIRRSNR